MIINVKASPKGQWEPIEIEKSCDIEEIIHVYKERTGARPSYKYLIASVDNSYKELNTIISQPCNIEFIDMRTQAGNVTYQNSLALIFLAAVEAVMPGTDVEIQNALNKSLYTIVKSQEPVTEKQLLMIEKKMREFILADMPIVKSVIPISEAGGIVKKNRLNQKMRILDAIRNVETVVYYSLGDYSNFFYSPMVPSTGYIQFFELQKYREGIRVRYPDRKQPDRMTEYTPQEMLYKAFDEAQRWNELMGVEYIADLNAKIRFGGMDELVEISEALHERKVVEIAHMIEEQKKRIILIAGPSSSGKTTFARRLQIQLMVRGIRPLCLSTDDYYRERVDAPRDEYGEKNFENLEALDLDLFNSNLNSLLAGETVDLPSYNFMTGEKEFGKRIVKLEPEQPVIIEGIHGLNEAMTKDVPKEEKFKIYISPFTQLNVDEHNRISTMDARLLRRMVRDNAKRGTEAQGTIDAWPKVRDAEEVNIFPYIDESDVIFNSVHIYELAVLKKYAAPLLKSITPDEPQHGEARRLLSILALFEKMEDDSIIVNNSILREFIGGSVYERE